MQLPDTKSQKKWQNGIENICASKQLRGQYKQEVL